MAGPQGQDLKATPRSRLAPSGTKLLCPGLGDPLGCCRHPGVHLAEGSPRGQCSHKDWDGGHRGSTEGCSEKQVEALAWDWTDAAGSEGHSAPSGGLQPGWHIEGPPVNTSSRSGGLLEPQKTDLLLERGDPNTAPCVSVCPCWAPY